MTKSGQSIGLFSKSQLIGEQAGNIIQNAENNIINEIDQD